MIAIFIATKSEAHFFLKYLYPVKKAGIFHYRGLLVARNAALYLTRPGVAAKEQARRFLRLYQYDAIFSTGSCAALTSELTHLTAVSLSEVCTPDKKNLLIGGNGIRCVSVPQLVIKDSDKARLSEVTQATVLDQETYTLRSISLEAEFQKTPFFALRIIDDLHGDDKYLLKEKALRELTVATPSGRLKIVDIWRFGVWDFIIVLLRRHRVARAIFTHSKKAIQALPR